jgi:hypothetical protein
MFDVFYSGIKPNRFAHEQAADSIDHAQELSRTRYFWWINYLTDYAGFDFLYEPVPWEKDQRHAWPSQWQKDAETYLVPKSGYTETNYRTAPILTRLPSRDKWTVPDTFDPDTFDFSWHPDTTEPGYIYQFGTQHQRTGGPQYRVNGAVDLKFCDQVRGSVKSGATPIVEINHMDGYVGQVAGVVSTVRYFDNYKDILTRIANTSEHEYIWIVSSCCDYTNFDFSWHPELWQNTMLHVFASSGEKFGDTFFMHVPSFRRRIGQFELLDWYDVNFVGTSVPRRPLPVIRHEFDTHVEAIKTIDWSGPLAVFSTDNEIGEIPTVPLWREKTKTIVPLSPGASKVIVPKTAVPYVKRQAYDYPYIDRKQRHMYTDEPLDIVFIDNGEPNADANFAHLTNVKLLSESSLTHLNSVTYNLQNRLHRSSGVNGRVAAYCAAAELSKTPWFFAVFAKLEISLSFDWTWQPDRLQEPKHYIFHAKNPVNGLVYGHQAMIAYNKQLVLTNTAPGLDFTLDQEHEVVPVLSGTAHYNDTPWMAWRTAFRECIKLKASLPDVENEYRLNRWCVNGEGANAQWSSLGAQDALEYYDAVGGDFAELKKSYDWAWLASYALLKRNLTQHQ